MGTRTDLAARTRTSHICIKIKRNYKFGNARLRSELRSFKNKSMLKKINSGQSPTHKPHTHTNCHPNPLLRLTTPLSNACLMDRAFAVVVPHVTREVYIIGL